MKTCRNIIFISAILTIISAISILFISKEDKFYDIFMGLMTGAFISFMLEIPNYIRLKHENFNILFNNFFNIKAHLSIFKNIIESHLENNNNITSNFYDQNINTLFYDISLLQKFDNTYFLLKNKNINTMDLITDINEKINTLNIYSITYNINYNKTKINYIENTNQDIPITAIIMNKELSDLINLCNEIMKSIDKCMEIIVNKKQFNKWVLLSEKLKNNSYNFKISQKNTLN